MNIEAIEFLPNIFIGNYIAASDSNFFRENNICRVINCAKGLPNYFENEKKINYFNIPVHDNPTMYENAIMQRLLPDAIKFVMEKKKDDGVLIHCHAGISRSATVCVAILRTCCFKNISDAVNYLRQRRPKVFYYGMFINFKSALYAYFGN